MIKLLAGFEREAVKDRGGGAKWYGRIVQLLDEREQHSSIS